MGEGCYGCSFAELGLSLGEWIWEDKVNNTDLFLITINFLSLANHHQIIVPGKQKFHFSGAGL